MYQHDDIRFTSGGLTLAGTVYRPDGPGPHPALVMLQGSGAEDRDSHGYFPPIRDEFLANGIAVYSWDKPGIGDSSGDWHQRDLFDRANEALDAIAALRAQPGIDPARVGIWGHSQGGWIGPLAASKARDLAFLIVNSGPAVDVHEQDLFGIEQTLRRDGASEDEITEAIAFMTRVHEATIADMPYDDARLTILEPARGTAGETYFGEIYPELWQFLVLVSQNLYDPVSVLEQITCPTLALYGELDVLTPVARSVPLFE
ncbi:MAG TPA: alpha/beta fold hydrolase, partial [Nitrolancea sp.]|nr:alpha/beta fold hydrolase [Nitrolancea sp.]